MTTIDPSEVDRLERSVADINRALAESAMRGTSPLHKTQFMNFRRQEAEHEHCYLTSQREQLALKLAVVTLAITQQFQLLKRRPMPTNPVTLRRTNAMEQEFCQSTEALVRKLESMAICAKRASG